MPNHTLNQEQLLMLTKPLLHAIIQLDCMESNMPVTQGMKRLLREECNHALDKLWKMETTIIEQEKQIIISAHRLAGIVEKQ